MAGHKIADCHNLKNQKCFKCREYEHTREHCPKIDKVLEPFQPMITESDALDAYIRDRNILKAPSKPLREEEKDNDDVSNSADEEELPTAKKIIIVLLMGQLPPNTPRMK